jgi:hypothetical protein
MSYDYSLMDAMGNYTGGSVDPFAAPDNSTTATTQVAQTAPAFAPQPARVNGIPSKYRTGPVSADYNANIAQQESGGRADIGFHNKEKSSAYGPYGMTTAAYQDARKVNPTLPEDITQATPEQLTAGQDAYTQQNAKYLTNYGIEPTANTLSAAHFLGAKGLSDYMKTGYISPQAAAANGGEENVRKIVNARLGGQAAPASGAVQQAAPQTETAVNPETGETYQKLVSPAAPAPISPEQAAQAPAPAPEAYTGGGLTIGGKTQADLERDRQHNTILNSNSQETLSKLAFDPNTPRDVASAAFDKLHGTMAVQTGMDKAKQKMAELGTSPNPQALNKAMNDKETGSYLKVLLFQALGWTGKAQQELDRIMPSVTYSGVTLPTGENYNVKYNKTTGEAIAAWDSQGQPVTDKATLGAIAAGGVNPATAKSYLMPQTSGSPVTKSINGQLVNGIQIYDPVRKSFYVQYGNQRDNNPEGWTSAAQNVDQQALLGKQKAQIDLMKKFEGANIDAKYKYIEDTNKALVGQFGPNAPLITPADVGLQAPQAPGAQPAGAVAPTGRVTGGAVAPGTPAATGVVPPTPAANVPTTTAGGQKPPMTLSEIEKEKERQKIERELGKTSSEGVLKHINENVVPASMAATDGSDAVKRQFKIINDPTSNALFGLYNKAQSNSTSDKNWAIIRDWLGGKLDPNDQTKISEAIAKVKLDSTEQSAATLFLAENIRLANAMIKSGVFGTGASISTSDRESAERAQLDINTTPALAIFAGKSQQLFGFDVSRAKMDWAADKKFDSVAQMEKEWTRQQAKLVEQYGKVADERNMFIKANSDNKPATIGLVRKAYEMYPVPQYDPNLNSGAGGWKNLETQRERENRLKNILQGNR